MSDTSDEIVAKYETRLNELEARLRGLEGGAPAPAVTAAAPAAAKQGANGHAYRLGVDVGGTFTDLLLIDEVTGRSHIAKVPSTPEDSSIGVLDGITRVCDLAGVDPRNITHVMHGTTVATNTVLTGTGAKVGLVTTMGYRQVLQIARSFVPGGLGGWVIFNKTDPLAPLEYTIEAEERIGAQGDIVTPLNKAKLEADLARLKNSGIEALTICLINAYANGEHEIQVREIAEKVVPGIPVSISSEVIPEMQEYERTETTVVNSYVRPVVSKYIRNMEDELTKRMGDVQLHILRSDGGLASAETAISTPVHMLMSGPAGGVSGAIWAAQRAGYEDLLTFDMGGTSTDVGLVQNGVAQTRRETRIGDVTVRASSVDVRTVGAGGGSIAYVPELTKALRVGPQSAGAVPGPAAYMKGGEEPTVTDANVVLGYLPSTAKLGGDMQIDYDLAVQAVQKVADAIDLPLKKTAEGIINIVNENMFGALRLVSIERGFDPRDFSLIGFGGAGPMHANALGKLTGAWPVIIPPNPGVLCAFGDATTKIRDEASRTYIRQFSETSNVEVANVLDELGGRAAETLNAEGVGAAEQETTYQIDLRYHGQGLMLTVDVNIADLRNSGLGVIGTRFDDMHEQLFTFALDAEHEFVNLRAIVQGQATTVAIEELASGGADATAAIIDEVTIFMEGKDVDAKIYDRSKFTAGNRFAGPAIVTEMDATSLILNGHDAEVDAFGNLLIRPIGH